MGKVIRNIKEINNIPKNLYNRNNIRKASQTVRVEKPNAKVQKKIKDNRDSKAKQIAAHTAEKKELRQKLCKEKSERDRLCKKRRLERTKVICKQTIRGQPLMKNRLEYLLKQIQKIKRG